jgi:3-methyl-2-oxobutanoate hydroxymethyltransferase
VEAAGAFAVVLESMPREVAAHVTEQLHIPTIGIGAGPECDGQVLVFHDLVGLTEGHTPKFVRRYAQLSAEISKAVSEFFDDVRGGRFPSDAESYHSAAEMREKVAAAARS